MIKECFFCEEAECYLVIGKCSKKEAIKAIHKLEKEEFEMEKEELYSEGDLKQIKLKIMKKDGMDWYDLAGKTGTDSWVGYI